MKRNPFLEWFPVWFPVLLLSGVLMYAGSGLNPAPAGGGGAGSDTTAIHVGDKADVTGLTNSAGTGGIFKLGRWQFDSGNGYLDGSLIYQVGQGWIGKDCGHLMYGIEKQYAFRLFGPPPFNTLPSYALGWSNGFVTAQGSWKFSGDDFGVGGSGGAVTSTVPFVLPANSLAVSSLSSAGGVAGQYAALTAGGVAWTNLTAVATTTNTFAQILIAGNSAGTNLLNVKGIEMMSPGIFKNGNVAGNAIFTNIYNTWFEIDRLRLSERITVDTGLPGGIKGIYAQRGKFVKTQVAQIEATGSDTTLGMDPNSNRMKIVSNTANYATTTNTPALNAILTNGPSRGTVGATGTLTPNATDFAEIALYIGGVEVDAARAAQGLTAASVGKVSGDLNPGQTFFISNTCAGTATATIRSYRLVNK